jgi:hypothetical protein
VWIRCSRHVQLPTTDEEAPPVCGRPTAATKPPSKMSTKAAVPALTWRGLSRTVEEPEALAAADIPPILRRSARSTSALAPEDSKAGPADPSRVRRAGARAKAAPVAALVKEESDERGARAAAGGSRLCEATRARSAPCASRRTAPTTRPTRYVRPYASRPPLFMSCSSLVSSKAQSNASTCAVPAFNTRPSTCRRWRRLAAAPLTGPTTARILACSAQSTCSACCL